MKPDRRQYVRFRRRFMRLSRLGRNDSIGFLKKAVTA